MKTDILQRGDMRTFLRAMILFACILLGQNVFASAIAVEPLEVDLNPVNRYQDIQVHNIGSDTAYVQVSVARIDQPGLPTQTLVQLNDNPYQVGLIVTPSKVVIPVGQTRIVRVLYVGEPPTSDIVYHLKIAPVSGQLIALYSGTNKLNAGVQLIVAYGVSVYARPLKLNPQVVAQRDGKDLTLSNTGNTSVLITLCKQCSGTTCQAVPDLLQRLFPGNIVHLNLPKDAPIQCQEEVLHNQFIPFNVQ
jgi:P pilus assembly chaperone PapD